MRLKEVGSGYVTLTLDPGDCLMLAHAIGYASEDADNTNQRTLAGTLRLAAAHFEALALLADAHCCATPGALDTWSLATVRKDWAWLPEWQEVKR